MDLSTIDSITGSSSMKFDSSELSDGNSYYQGNTDDYTYECVLQYNNSEDHMYEIKYRFNNEWPW